MSDRKQQQEITDATPESNGMQGTGIKVPIQGYEGSFHQVAARQFFGKNVEVIACATFRDVIKIATNEKVLPTCGYFVFRQLGLLFINFPKLKL